MADSRRTQDESDPTDHLRVYVVPDVADLTVRGLAECTCGVRYPAAGGTCPDATKTRREAASGGD